MSGVIIILKDWPQLFSSLGVYGQKLSMNFPFGHFFYPLISAILGKGKAFPLHAWTGP
jgi:hypothetical protein